MFPPALAADRLQSLDIDPIGSLLLASMLRAKVFNNRDHLRGKKATPLPSDPEDEGTLDSFPEPDPCGYQRSTKGSSESPVLNSQDAEWMGSKETHLQVIT